MTTPENTARLEHLLATMFQSHPWHGVRPHTGRPDVARAYIEIVPTDAVKYELDKASGHLAVDRPQRLSSMCPTLYGFIPQTYCGPRVGERCATRTGATQIEGDGDPLDVCVLTEKPFTHGNFLVNVRMVGGLRMIDGNQADDKIIAVLENDVVYGHAENLSDCPTGLIERLRHYFLSYKHRPDDSEHRVRIAEIYDREEAREVLQRSCVDYVEKFGDPGTRMAEAITLARS